MCHLSRCSKILTRSRCRRARVARRQLEEWAVRDSRNGIYGTSSSADAASLWLDAGEPDNFAPFFDFPGNKLSKVGGRPGRDPAGASPAQGKPSKTAWKRVLRLRPLPNARPGLSSAAVWAAPAWAVSAWGWCPSFAASLSLLTLHARAATSAPEKGLGDSLDIVAWLTP